MLLIQMNPKICVDRQGVRAGFWAAYILRIRHYLIKSAEWRGLLQYED